MINKNYYLKKLAVSLSLLTITLILVYYKNVKQYPILDFLQTNQLLTLNTKLKQMQTNTMYSIQSILQATRYKRELLECRALLKKQQLDTTLQTSDNTNNLKVLAIDWPDIGFIAINNPDSYIQQALLVDSHNLLIGTVEFSNKNILIVKTILANDFQTAIYLKQAKAYGVLKNQKGQLLVTQINIQHKVRPGDIVYVLDKRYPTNIKIGRINKITSTKSSAFTTATVTPFYKTTQDISNITDFKLITPQK